MTPDGKKQKKKKSISPYLADSLPCPLLSHSPQVVFQGYINRKHEKKNRFLQRYVVVYGFRIYFYTNLSDASFKCMFFLKNENITTEVKGNHTFMTLKVYEADLKEKFYLNPKVGYDMEVSIEMDPSGQKLKVHLENIMAYRNLVKSKAKISRMIELNSKLTSFYQESTREKLALEYTGEKFRGLDNSGVDDLLFRSFKLHSKMDSLIIRNVHLKKDAIEFIFKLIDVLKYKIRILKFENCNINSSCLIYFIRFIKSPNFTNMKMLSLRGNKLNDGFVEEVLSCLMERIDTQ